MSNKNLKKVLEICHYFGCNEVEVDYNQNLKRIEVRYDNNTIWVWSNGTVQIADMNTANNKVVMLAHNLNCVVLGDFEKYRPEDLMVHFE